MHRRRYAFDAEALCATRTPLVTTLSTANESKKSKPRTPDYITTTWLLTFVLATIFALVAGILFNVGAIKIGSAVFSLGTNVLFLWPIALAWHVGATSIAVVLVTTLLASLLHHSCDGNDNVRMAFAVPVYILGAVVFVVLLVMSFCVVTKDNEPLRYRGYRAGVFGVLAVASIVLAIVAGAGSIDGCLYVHEPGSVLYATQLHDLRRMWSFLDDVAALTALVAALVFLTRSKDLNPFDVGHFWFGAAIVIVVHAYHIFLNANNVLVYVVLGIVLGIIFVPRLYVAANDSARRIHWLELVGVVVLGAVAVLDFAEPFSPWGHGAWHVLAALSVSVLIDASRT